MSAPTIQPLFNVEAEQSVIGGLLLDPRAWDSIGDLIAESDFYTESHRLIFRRIGLMSAQGFPIDVVTVAEALESAGDGERTGGLAYLGELAFNTPSVANIRRYAEIVLDRRQLRGLKTVAVDISDLAMVASTEPASVRIEKAQSLVLALTQEQTQTDPQPIGSILFGVVEEIERRHDRQGEISGLRTGFANLDKITNGLQRGDLIIVAGRPSMGKTAFALNVAENVALSGSTALVFSLEMGKEALTERAIASIGGLSIGATRSGRLNDDDYSRLSFALGKLSNAKLIIDDQGAPTIGQMRSRARRVKRQHGLDLIIVDYIQLMAGEGGNRNEQVGSITRGLKLLARELDVPLIALSQLSRDVEKRPDKRPMMSDLRDSGSIEQDADLILMAYRDEYYNPDGPYKGLAEMLIRKHRMGELGEIRLVFQGEFSRFRDADQDAWRQAQEAARTAKPTARRRIPFDE
ncbi:MAG: replicative DNA helicase [Azonexus sp.]